jgi:hypothetical protein
MKQGKVLLDWKYGIRLSQGSFEKYLQVSVSEVGIAVLFLVEKHRFEDKICSLKALVGAQRHHLGRRRNERHLSRHKGGNSREMSLGHESTQFIHYFMQACPRSEKSSLVIDFKALTSRVDLTAVKMPDITNHVCVFSLQLLFHENLDSGDAAQQARSNSNRRI